MKIKALRVILCAIFLISLVCALSSCEELLGMSGGTNSNQNLCATHTFGEWSEDTATCVKSGAIRRTCSVCSYVEALGTEPLGHDLISHEKKSPSCTEGGYEAYKSCTRCSYATAKTTLPKLSHKIVRYELKPATCTEAGHNEYMACELCDYSTYIEISATGHSFGDWTGDSASCTEAGEESRECLTCGESETRETEIKPHLLGNIQENTATCDTGGEGKKYCVRCSYYETVATEPLGHLFGSWSENSATCTEAGEVKRYCLNSGCQEYETKPIAATGHKFGNWRSNTATCTEGGEEYRYCTGCSHFETRDTDALGHDFSNEICKRCRQSDLNILIFDSSAEFKVVYTSSLGAVNKRLADNLVAQLRARGVEISDAVSDEDVSAVSEREIIIGTNVKNRPDECFIDSRYLGKDGYSIKTVGKRIVIAGGSETTAETALNLYTSSVMKLGSSQSYIEYLGVSKSYSAMQLTEYPIKSITVGGVDLKNYTLILDIGTMAGYDTAAIEAFRENLYDVSGYWLDLGTVSNQSSYSNCLIISCTDSVGDAFKAYTSGNDFIIACKYPSVFNQKFEAFVNENILDKTGNVTLESDFLHEETLGIVSYEDFGAVGDGVTCDFNAIYNAHTYANQYGFRVVGKAGASYYISPSSFTKTIPIKTDTDFCGATFIIDDTGSSAHKYRGLKLFTVAREESLIFKDADADGVVDNSSFANVTIHRTDTKFEWLEGFLAEKSIVRVISTKHKDFIRHGVNQSSGENRQDVFIVDTDGTLAEDTPVVFEFDGDIKISELHIYSAEETPITVKNGTFINICCKTVSDTSYISKYRSYYRGFEINRANVTMSNITHKMQDEPAFGYAPQEAGYTKDSLHTNYGSRCESYPYYGFFYILGTYNLNITDCTITGHTTYYENKGSTTSTGNSTVNPVAMGSYDFVIDRSVGVTFTRVIQPTPTGLGDKSIWGIMSSNGTKNMTFDSCEINRFDAHRGFFNAKILNSTIGHSINLVGGGTFYMENSSKLSDSYFISLRGDYGATFEGDVILKDCTHYAYSEYYSSRGGKFSSTSINTSSTVIKSGYSTSNGGYVDGNTDGAYWCWDFGYTCYMPKNVTLDNYQTNASKIYVFNNLPDNIFTYSPGTSKTSVTNVYQLTKSITLKNMGDNVKVCSGSSSTYKKLYSIPITRED